MYQAAARLLAVITTNKTLIWYSVMVQTQSMWKIPSPIPDNILSPSNSLSSPILNKQSKPIVNTCIQQCLLHLSPNLLHDITMCREKSHSLDP